jgi:hypothetical protein
VPPFASRPGHLHRVELEIFRRDHAALAYPIAFAHDPVQDKPLDRDAPDAIAASETSTMPLSSGPHALPAMLPSGCQVFPDIRTFDLVLL